MNFIYHSFLLYSIYTFRCTHSSSIVSYYNAKICSKKKFFKYCKALTKSSRNEIAEKFVSSTTCLPSNFMANRRVPEFSLSNCAQSSKKTFMCPKFCTNPVLKYTKCHISANLSNFLKLCLLYCQKLFALALTNCRFAEKKQLSGNAVYYESFLEHC